MKGGKRETTSVNDTEQRMNAVTILTACFPLLLQCGMCSGIIEGFVSQLCWKFLTALPEPGTVRACLPDANLIPRAF